MKILGISHDVLVCSACLVEDGRVVVAIPEERVDRVKQSRGFPILAIRECLNYAGWSFDQIDEIAVAWNPGIDAETTPSGYLTSRRWRSEHLLQVPSRLLELAQRGAQATMSHTDLWRNACPITYVDHYLAHVGDAFFLSPYESCAVLVVDGRAERDTGLLAKAHGVEVEVLGRVRYPHSLGLVYGAVTQFLGFRPDSDEWKVMALASYASGSKEVLEAMRRLVTVDRSGGFTVALEFFEYYNFTDPRMYSDRFVEVFGEPRQPADAITERHMLIAAALQQMFEEVVTEVLARLYERTKTNQLVVTGGCFMNSVYNGKIATQSAFSDCFITSSPDDSGTSVGAALYLHGQRTGTRVVEACSHNYWGMEFSDEDCQKIAAGYKLPNAKTVDDPATAAAADLVGGRLVGWFQGRAEFGQRALGNRSILADPRRPEVKDLVNSAVKFREDFRPFAPAILTEFVAEYFDCEPSTRVPFMEKVLRFRDEKRNEVPAVVHVDGTGRPQTVGPESSLRFRRLIRRFHEQTGVPLVLNTSFNLNGEPIVNSPDDAIRTFYSCGLDVLYLGCVRISK